MKRNRVRIFFVFAIAWLCAGSLPAEIIVPEGVEITETNLWTPFVETLRIRETPDLNGQVIATIKLGEQVEYAGETSKNTSTVDFNGEKITDSWIKVKMKDGRIGWGWKGFMIGLKKYWDPKTKTSFLLVNFNDKIDLNIDRNKDEESIISPGDRINYYAIDKIKFPKNHVSEIMYKNSEIYIGYIKINEYFFKISINLSDTSHYAKKYKYFVFMGVEKNEYEKKILPLLKNETKYNEVVNKYKLFNITAHKQWEYQYQSDSRNAELSNFWAFLYTKGYRPNNVLYPDWIITINEENQKERYDVIYKFLDEIKSGNSTYLLTQWYNGAEIIFNSMEKE